MADVHMADVQMADARMADACMYVCMYVFKDITSIIVYITIHFFIENLMRMVSSPPLHSIL